MPRLPDATNLGGLPSANSARPIASFDTTAIGRGAVAEGQGMQNLARGVNQLGQGVASFVEGQTKQAHELDFARAQSAWLVNKSKIDEQRDLDHDPDSLSKYGEQYQKAADAAAGAIADPVLRERFKLGVADDVQNGVVGANKRSYGIKRDSLLSESEQRLQDLRKAGLSTTDDKERGRIIAAGGAEIDGLAKAGFISQQDAFRWKETWSKNYAVSALEMMPAGERLAALSKPSADIGDERHAQAFQFFRSKGWTPEQAAGIVGNLSLESGGLKTAALNRGDGSDGSDSIGLAQWNAQRAVALRNFAKAKGQDWRDFSTQLAFVQHELETTEASAGRSLKNATSVREAAGVFANEYERPAGSGGSSFASISGWGKRVANAEGVAQKHGKLAPSDIPGARLADALQPDQVQTLRERTEREIIQEERKTQIANRAEVASVKSLLNDDVASIMQTGKPVEDLTEDRVKSALGEEGAQVFKEQRKSAQRYYDETHDWGQIPEGEIADRLDNLKPEAGKPNFADQQKMYDAAVKQAQALVKERREDPAGAVDQLDDVKAVRQSANINDPASFAPLVKARLAAQTRLGIPEDQQSPITRNEAKALVLPIQQALPGQEKATLEETMRLVKDAFGDKADRAVEYMLREAKLDKDTREVAGVLFRKLGLGQPITREDAKAMDEASKSAAVERATEPVAPRNYGPGFNPRGVTASRQEAPKPKFPMPTDQDIDELRANPNKAKQFESVFGDGSAQRVLEAYPPSAGFAPTKPTGPSIPKSGAVNRGRGASPGS